MWRLATNKKGFTLIELLVSMLVLSIGMMAILDGLGNYIRINIDNSIRNEAMRISESTLETLRNSRFDEVQSGTVVINSTEQRKIRNFDITYNVNWVRQNVSTSSVAIQVNVTWTHRGLNHRHDAATIISTEA
ncbi:MAG TPA: type II secretion system protein [Syntrophorhabdaceae bacterium]|nr:type II secretion system protein [Syntrophorhabdaceae bacterium]